MSLIKLNASYKDFHNGILRSRNNATTVKRRFQFSLKQNVYYPLYTALLLDSRWIGNPTNHSSTTVSF